MLRHISLLCSMSIKQYLRSLNDKMFCAFLVLEAKNIRFYSNFRVENIGKKRGLSVAERAKIVALNKKEYLGRQISKKKN